jgi:hypothetical protein
MENNEISESESYSVSTQKSERKRPPIFVVVLVILSLLYISSGLYSAIAGLVSGPFSQEQMEQIEITFASSINEMKSMGQEGFAGMMQTLVERIHYANDVVFYKQNAWLLIVFLIGLAGVVQMLRLKKTGFHLYIIYSLLTVAVLYIVFPTKLILTIEVVWSLLLSSIFCLLYSLNLKHMN